MCLPSCTPEIYIRIFINQFYHNEFSKVYMPIEGGKYHHYTQTLSIYLHNYIFFWLIHSFISWGGTSNMLQG